MASVKRDHGGDLDRAKAAFGAGDWLDLSTGINPVAYPVPTLPDTAWTTLPTATDIARLEQTAATAYRSEAAVVALAGAQAAIQLVPRLATPGRACVVGPTYNEHAAALRAQGWEVTMIDTPADGIGADLVTVVNPNNPDGRIWQPEALLALRGRVGLLVVDESFGDTAPDLSLAPHLGARDEGIVVMRSFGKFYGLAGLRLGFAITGSTNAAKLRGLAGPWAVNGPALATGCAALADVAWQQATCARLAKDAVRLDALAVAAGWTLIGGTPLFRTYDTTAQGGARAAQDSLAQSHIWSRIFPYSEGWIRLGLPGSDAGWAQLDAALA
ncbi:threonine-phosphate decarboxylase CobD [Marinovum sp. KMM 9879]